MEGGTETRVEIQDLLEETVAKDASDLHIGVGIAPTLRVDGKLTPIPGHEPLTAIQMQEMVGGLLDKRQQTMLTEGRELDFSFAYGEIGRFRVNIFHQRGVLAGAFRLIPTKIRTAAELGLPKVVEGFTGFPQGLVLFTGPVGHGKSTSMAALIDQINHAQPVHVITVEDPIEYNHTNHLAIVDQREVHYDTLSFAAALRSVLREDPDVVLIGEMRDLETIAAALTIAETGHLVFATIHTNNSAQTVDRIVDVFPAHQQQQIRIQLAATLQAVVSQRLVPAIGGGRILSTEVMVVNSAVRNLIREAKSHQIDSVIQTGAEVGMQSLDKDLAALVRSGKVGLEEAKNYCVDVAEFTRLTA